MNYAGKFDATFASPGPDTHSHAYAHVDSSQTHAPADAVIVPDAQLLFHADYSRSGTDLILSRDHHEYVVHDYFTGGKRAPLASPDGAHLTADIVKSLVGEVDVSQAGAAPAASQVIGHVTKLQGSATVIRNGVSIILNMGDNVEKGDVVESGANSTLGITFIDGTVFGLSSNARMVLNEMVYDPNGSNNSSLLSLVAGTITFVAGETAKHGDMKVDTPVATMGIRGTAVLVEIDFTVPGQGGNPNASFQVLVEPDGTTGSYILFDKNTLQPIAIVNQAGQQVNINNGIINITTNPLSPELQKLITDVFQQKFTDNTNTKSTAPSTDSIIPTSTPLVIKTAEALITAQTVTVQGSSASPPPTTQGSSTFHVPGAPIVHIGTLLGVETTSFFASGELPGLTGSPLPDGAVGIVSFNDINVGDRPSVTPAFSSFTYTNAHGQNVTAGLSALQLADIAATEANLTIVPGPNNTNIGSAFFVYGVADQAFDFLAAGEQLTLTYLITVNENYAPDPTAKITIPITITITGTNDVPVITTSAQTIAFTPSGTKTVGGDLQTKNATSGTLAFTDVDLTDTHTVSTKLTSAVMSNGGTVPPLPESVFEAALNAEIGIDSTGTGAGTINWQLAALPVYLSDFIPPGQTLTLTYTITVTDSQGAISTQTVTVTISGNNEPAVVWIHTTTDGHDNLWTTANNWETGNVPTSSDDVIIITDQLHPNTPAYPVTIDGTTNAAANSVTMNDFVNLPPELDVLQGGSLTIGDGLSMSADSILRNAGTVSVGGKIELLDSVDSDNKFLALNQSVIVNSGTLDLAQGGDLQGSASITNTGLIDLQGGALNILVDIANSGINGNGKPVDGRITVENGAKLALGHDSNNKTTVNGGISGGTLTIKGELDLQGSSFVKDGTLDNSGHVFISGLGNSFDAETIVNAGTIELTSGALLIDLASSVSGSGTITLDGTAALTLSDAMISGNTIDDNSSTGIDVTGASTINGNATLNNGTVNVDAKLTLDTMTVSGTTINDNSDGSIDLDHTVELTGGATIQGSLNALGAITNLGTLEMSGTAELVDDSLINGAGIIQVDNAETLMLDGTTITGGAINDYDAKGGGIIHVTGDSTINGSATLTKGTVNVDAKLTLDMMTVTGTTIRDNSDGGIEIDHTVKLTGGATIQGSSNALGAITNLGTLEISGTAELLDDSLINGAGIVEVDGTNILTLDGTTIAGGTINNYDGSGGGTIEVKGSSKIQGATIQGVLTTATLTNGGVTIDAGQTLTLDNVTVTGSTFTDTATGATLALDAGTLLTISGATIHGGTINDGTSGAGATIDVTGSSTINSGATLNNGAVDIAQGMILTLDDVTVTGTSFVMDGQQALGELILQDATSLTGSQITIDGNDKLILDQATITGGSIANGDTIEVRGSSKIQGTTTQGVVTAATLSDGVVMVDAGQTLTLDNVTVTGATFTDTAAGATLALDAGTQLALDGMTVTGGSISDNGTVKVDGGNKLILDGVALSGGAITNLGTIDISATGNIENDAFANTGGTLQVDGGTTLTLDGTTITGGTVTDSGTIAVDGSKTLKLSGVAVSGGNISNAGTIEISATGSIENDALANTGGILQVGGGTTLTLDGTTITGGTINGGGTLNVDGGNQLTLNGVAVSGGSITSAGTIEITGTGSIESETFGNTSLIVDSGKTLTLDGATITGGGITNGGTLNVDGGNQLTLNGVAVTGGSITDNGTLEIEGTVKLAGGATIQGASSTVLSAITNLGLLEIIGAATLLDVTVANASNNIQVDSGHTLDFDNSTINGGTLTVNGEFDSNGTSSIHGSTIINQNNIHVISGTLTIDPTPVSNSGTIEAMGGATLVIDGETITNSYGGTSGTILVDGNATLDLHNAEIDGGNITINGELDSSGTSTISGVTIVNDGIIDIKSGSLTIDAASMSGTGRIKMDGGSLDLKGALVGDIDISGTATVELGSNLSTAYSAATVIFDQGSTGTLKLDYAEDFSGHIAGFNIGQTLDLADIAYSSKPTVVYTGDASSGVLAVYVGGNDVANIHLTGDYLGVQWNLSSDGQQGGTDISASEGVLAATLDHSTAQQGVTMHVTGVTDSGDVLSTGVSYSWQMSTDGQTWTSIGSGTSFTPGEAQEGHFMQLVVTYTNALGTQQVAYGLGMPNDLAITVDQTTAQQGLPIDVTSVTDGGTAVSSGVTYLWETSSDGHTWTQVGHSSSYTPSFTNDGGKLLQLVVSYSDPGESESVTQSFGTVALAKEWSGGNHSWETGTAWKSAGAPTSTDNAVVDTNGHVTVDQASAVAHSLVENASQATVEIAFGGKLTLGGNLVIDQGHLQVDLGGTLKDIAGSAIISGSFANNGTVEAGGGKLEVADAVSGFGGFKIDAGATLQLDHASSASVTFSGSGTLALEDPTHFTGIISDSTGSLTDKDVLDLAGFDTKASVNYFGGTSVGVVVVSENNKVATIAVGANTTHWTKPASDGHGGILIEDPVQNDAAPNANTSNAWTTAGADSFVFKTDPGAAADADHSPVWPEPDHPDAAAKFAQLLQSHDAAGLPHIPGLLDTVTPDSLKTQLLAHHNEFHFV